MNLLEKLKQKDIVNQTRNIIEYRDLIRRLSPTVMRLYCAHVRKKQDRFAASLKNKNRIEVAFFLSTPSMWKADYLFRLLQQDERYHPYVVVVPYVLFKSHHETINKEAQRLTCQYLEERGFEYIIPYDEKRRKWVDIKKSLNPDIVFFTSPYKDAQRKYYVYHFTDRLTFYIPYSYTTFSIYQTCYNRSFHNVVWRYCLESPIHLRFAQAYSWVRGNNTLVTGFPGLDIFFDTHYQPQDPWKPQPQRKKRLIWAPHHSIEGAQNGVSHDEVFASTFLTFADYFLQLAQRHEQELQIAFKPHPALKRKLYDLWGVERTQQYYCQWDNLPNTQLMEGDYHDLFLTSDAMVHDCGSFTTEYLYLHKPVMYLVQPGSDPTAQFNESGLRSFELHSHGSTSKDIDRFVRQLIDDEDEMKKAREEFFNTVLKPSSGKIPSQNIVDYLNSLL